jgi:carbon monoxide dehydrogenase subunit G
LHLANRFDVPNTPEATFALLLDAPSIAHCVPGAELVSVEADDALKGRIAVKLGPVALKFNGTVIITDVDEAARTAVIKAKGADAQGRGGANATTRMRVEPLGDTAQVFLETELQLSGMIAQYGRAQGVIAAVSNEIVADFSRNLQAMLAGEASPGGKHEISALSLAWRALRGKSGAASLARNKLGET